MLRRLPHCYTGSRRAFCLEGARHGQITALPRDYARPSTIIHPHGTSARHVHSDSTPASDRRLLEAFRSRTSPPKRTLNFEQQCVALEKLTGYHFIDRDYVRVAFSSDGRVSLNGNAQLLVPQKHLALIGDAALRLIYYAQNFPSMTPKSLFSEFGHFGSNRELTSLAFRCGLYDITGSIPSGIHSGGTIIEAVWGAIFIDSGDDIEAVKRAMDAMLAAGAQVPRPSSLDIPPGGTTSTAQAAVHVEERTSAHAESKKPTRRGRRRAQRLRRLPSARQDFARQAAKLKVKINSSGATSSL